MSTTMRAKFEVCGVTPYPSEGPKTQETIAFRAVGGRFPYPEDGSDEDNTYAKFTPMANASITIANPALFDQFKAGDKFFVDFTRVPAPAPVEEPAGTTAA